MVKQCKPSQRHRQQHYFTLVGSRDTYYRTPIEVDFAPAGQASMLPVFNRDGRHETPAWLPKSPEGQLADYEAQHREKVEAALRQEDTAQIMVARPKTSKSYCGVCRGPFEDYLAHIRSDNHARMLTTSSFSHQIRKLCAYIQGAGYSEAKDLSLSKSAPGSFDATEQSQGCVMTGTSTKSSLTKDADAHEK